jgi:uncharacterized membrane protein
MIAAALVLALATAGGVIALWPGEKPRAPAATAGDSQEAEVTAAVAVDCRAPQARNCTRISARLLEGDDRGQMAHFRSGESLSAPEFSVGDHLRVAKNQLPPGAPADVDPYSFVDFERKAPLLWLAIGFGLLVLVFARWRGLFSLLGLGCSLVAVFLFVVPALLEGSSALAVATVGSLAVMFLTISLAHGLGPKTIAAMLGTTASLVLTIGLALAFTDLAHLTGLSSEESTLLLVGRSDLSLEGLVIAGMIIGALGVLDDVTVSQASAVMALRRANPGLRFRQLYREAFSVGRDHVAATVNTLALAYAGASLPVLLVFSVGGVELAEAVNREAVAQQLVAMLVGSVGLITAVPVTTALASLLARDLPPDQLGAGHSH